MKIDRADMEKTLQAIGRQAFPDDTEVHWHVREVMNRGGYVCVEAEPEPSTVGYPRFRFVLRESPGGKWTDHGCYCLDGGKWSLLYTSPGTVKDWQSLGFDTAA